MGLVIPLETLAKTPNRNKILVGFGVVLEGTLTPTTRIGADKETEPNPLGLAYLLGTKTPWIFQ